MATVTRAQADDQAAALEDQHAADATAALRKAVAAATAAILVQAATAKAAGADGQIPPATADRIRDLAAAAVTGMLAVDVTEPTLAAIRAAVHLALRHETPTLLALGAPVPDAGTVTAAVMNNPAIKSTVRAAQMSLRNATARAQSSIRTAPVRTPAQARALIGHAASVPTAVDRDIRTATVRAVNVATEEILVASTDQQAAAVPAGELLTPPRLPRKRAELAPPSRPVELEPATAQPAPVAAEAPPPEASTVREPLPETPRPVPLGMLLVWVAERDACLVCLALSGDTSDPHTGRTFDEHATFDTRPAPDVWPPGMPLTGPPRHPRCRCRLRVIAADNTMLPEALRREAQRTIARGWSGHTSRRRRLAAADRLLTAGMQLPRTVVARSAADVAAGSFSPRHLPRAPHLRDD